MTLEQGAQIASLYICVGHREPMRAVDTATLVAGFGIEGDRHATSEGIRTARQALLMDTETLNEFGLAHGEIRENITTTGIELANLPSGQRLALGAEVVLEITGHCAPCARMDEIRDGLKDELEGQRGMLTTVLQGGTIKVGGAISVLETVATQ